MVSWSESKESATATRAPPGQLLRRQRASGAHVLDVSAPGRFVPLPRLLLAHRDRSLLSASVPTGTQARFSVRACNVMSAVWMPGSAPTTAVM